MKYPAFDGSEPCAQVGSEHFFTENGTGNYADLAMVREMCSICPMKDPCLNYALHVNVYGVWAGTTESERRRMRRHQGIIPQPVLIVS